MRQATAKEIAERVTQKKCKLKIVRHRNCIFVGNARQTDYYGLDWNEALDKLLVKHGAAHLASTAQPKPESAIAAMTEPLPPSVEIINAELPPEPPRPCILLFRTPQPTS